jgi:hypothetical protein
LQLAAVLKLLPVPDLELVSLAVKALELLVRMHPAAISVIIENNGIEYLEAQQYNHSPVRAVFAS